MSEAAPLYLIETWKPESVVERQVLTAEIVAIRALEHDAHGDLVFIEDKPLNGSPPSAARRIPLRLCRLALKPHENLLKGYVERFSMVEVLSTVDGDRLVHLAKVMLIRKRTVTATMDVKYVIDDYEETVMRDKCRLPNTHSPFGSIESVLEVFPKLSVIYLGKKPQGNDHIKPPPVNDSNNNNNPYSHLKKVDDNGPKAIANFKILNMFKKQLASMEGDMHHAGEVVMHQTKALEESKAKIKRDLNLKSRRKQDLEAELKKLNKELTDLTCQELQIDSTLMQTEQAHEEVLNTLRQQIHVLRTEAKTQLGLNIFPKVQFFQCSGCHRDLSSPSTEEEVYQCIHAHPVCLPCFQKLRQCAICQVNFHRRIISISGKRPKRVLLFSPAMPDWSSVAMVSPMAVPGMPYNQPVVTPHFYTPPHQPNGMVSILNPSYPYYPYANQPVEAGVVPAMHPHQSHVVAQAPIVPQ
ncbi:hypothetical protein TCAL_14359 [Tigriopus californicus]|uniref:RING-type domain-containing protein n=1 Tax=Tigriopus californicus TaxID=6832 RepID=A0A553NBT1_TIGCA|nr:hypothetical protein TCAL_14359 [Tigriopus californicus]